MGNFTQFFFTHGTNLMGGLGGPLRRSRRFREYRNLLPMLGSENAEENVQVRIFGIKYKSTKCTFSKLILEFLLFLMSSTCFEPEASSIVRRPCIQSGHRTFYGHQYKQSDYTADTETHKTYCTISVYSTVSLKMNSRVRNMQKTSKLKIKILI